MFTIIFAHLFPLFRLGEMKMPEKELVGFSKRLFHRRHTDTWMMSIIQIIKIIQLERVSDA